MKTPFRIALCTLAVAASALPTFAADDVKELQGNWTVVSVERDGKMDDMLKGTVRENSGSQYTIKLKDGKELGGTFKADNVDGFIHLIHQGFGVSVRDHGDSIIVSL